MTRPYPSTGIRNALLLAAPLQSLHGMQAANQTDGYPSGQRSLQLAVCPRSAPSQDLLDEPIGVMRAGSQMRPAEELLTALRKGSTLRKYGRRGAPKFHHFRLSDDETALQWVRHGILLCIPAFPHACKQRNPRNGLQSDCRRRPRTVGWILSSRT